MRETSGDKIKNKKQNSQRIENVALRVLLMHNMLKKGERTCISVWKNKLTKQEGSLWFLLPNTGVM